MNFDINKWFSNITKDNVIIAAYQGNITGELITQLLEETEEKLDKLDIKSKIRKKLYNVIVESLQNLFHHAETAPEEYHKHVGQKLVSFSVCENNNEFKVFTGNFVKNDRIQLLKDRLDQINFLSKDELKALYKLILNNQEFSAKGGGGLGMIDIARKTGKKMHYQFYKINTEYLFFSLEIPI